MASGGFEQKLVTRFAYLLSGIVAFGALLDARSNALALSKSEAIAIAAVLALGWLIAEVWVKVRATHWALRQGSTIGIRGLGVAPRLAFVGALGLLIGARALTASGAGGALDVSTAEPTAAPMLQLELMMRLGGPQVRVVNHGPAPATQVTLSVTTWQIGAPAPEIMAELPIRDLPPNDDYVAQVDLYVRRADPDDEARRRNYPSSGHIVVRSIQSSRPRAWAFFLPPQTIDTPFDHTFAGSTWPLVEFQYPAAKPQGSPCVDHPKGVCERYGQEYLWRPTP